MFTYVLGVVGFLLLGGGILAGGILLFATIDKFKPPSADKPTADRRTHASNPLPNLEAGAAETNLWALFLIGTIGGLILVYNSLAPDSPAPSGMNSPPMTRKS